MNLLVGNNPVYHFSLAGSRKARIGWPELGARRVVHNFIQCAMIKNRGGEKMQDIGEMIKKLPPELQQEVEDFVKFLTEKRVSKNGKKLRQDWAGALREYRAKYTSLQLQKKALEWRGN